MLAVFWGVGCRVVSRKGRCVVAAGGRTTDARYWILDARDSSIKY